MARCVAWYRLLSLVCHEHDELRPSYQRPGRGAGARALTSSADSERGKSAERGRIAMSRKIGILGGTGPEGSGLAYRWGRAGEEIVIGSRDAQRAEETA